MEDLISLKLVADVWAKALLESGALSQASVDSNEQKLYLDFSVTGLFAVYFPDYCLLLTKNLMDNSRFLKC